jgi:hypothetical protein
MAFTGIWIVDTYVVRFPARMRLSGIEAQIKLKFARSTLYTHNAQTPGMLRTRQRTRCNGIGNACAIKHAPKLRIMQSTRTTKSRILKTCNKERACARVGLIIANHARRAP